MADAAVDNALIEAARRGVSVRVCGEDQDGEYDSAFSALARGGVRISYYHSSAGFYIHGKVIEADYGTREALVVGRRPGHVQAPLRTPGLLPRPAGRIRVHA